MIPQRIPDKLLNILVCPLCKSTLWYNTTLNCIHCGRNYCIIDGIPIMLVENKEAKRQHDFQKEYFDKRFSRYKDYKLDNWRISYIKRTFEALEIKENLDYGDLFYLDVGVGGSGYTVIEAAKKGIFSIGIDSSFVAMKKAKYFAQQQNVEHFISFVVCYAENLPFKAEVFSRISSIAVLEHIINDKQVIEEFHRVLKPEGKLFITVPHDFSKISPLLRIPYKLHDKRIGHLRHYSEEDIKRLFSSDKFRIEDIYCTGKLPKLLQMIFNKKFMGKIGEKFWWKIEDRDFNHRYEKTGVVLNVLLSKI